jgi:hypothetical protein
MSAMDIGIELKLKMVLHYKSNKQQRKMFTTRIRGRGGLPRPNPPVKFFLQEELTAIAAKHGVADEDSSGAWAAARVLKLAVIGN